MSSVSSIWCVVIDAVLQPLDQAGHMQELVTGILVQVGLIKVSPCFRNCPQIEI